MEINIYQDIANAKLQLDERTATIRRLHEDNVLTIEEFDAELAVIKSEFERVKKGLSFICHNYRIL